MVIFVMPEAEPPLAENSDTMKYAYFPGCALESTAKEYDISVRNVFANLNIQLTEIPDWICCGATPAHSVNKYLSIALPVKSLVWAEKNNLDVVAPCAACFSRLKISNLEVQTDRTLLAKINQILVADYQGKINVLNILDVLGQKEVLNSIKNKIKKRIAALKVVCYYGCLLTRPKKINVPHLENPNSMDTICKILGADPVDWPSKTECCGAGFSITKTEIVIKLTHDILEMAKSADAACIIVACPLCQSNLDVRQKAIEKEYHTRFDIPILYITQLIGLALGFSYKELALDKLVVEPKKLFKEGVLGFGC